MTQDSINLIQVWREAQDPPVRAAFDATVLLLRGAVNWEIPEIPEFKVLTEKHIGLSEIRFGVRPKRSERKIPLRRFRPVGIYWPEQRAFGFILGSEKMMRGGVYIPGNAFDIALNYKHEWQEGKGRFDEHVFSNLGEPRSE